MNCIYEVWSETNRQGKISLKRRKLEKYNKNKYVRENYFLSKSFREHPALISHSAARGSQTTSNTTNPSRVSYDVGAHWATMEARIFVAALTRAAKSQQE